MCWCPPARARSRPAWTSRPTRSASGCRAGWSSSSSARRVDLSLTGPIAPDGSVAAYAERYGADPTRYGPPAAPAAAGERDAHEPGHHHAPAGDAAAATVAQPTKVDNNLYVRDYSKCILCYKCVDACGEEAQNTFAIAVAGRGFDARISTEQAVPLPSRRASTAATASASARPAR